MSFDVTDRHDLEASLAAWKAQLAKERKSYSVATRGREALLKRVQKAKAMVERRDKQLAALPGPRRRAVDAALGYVGTTETPAGSNRGPRVDAWQRHFHMLGQPWCGAFVGNVIDHAGGKVTDRIVYTPYIHADAAAHRNGLDGVVWLSGFRSGAHVAHTADVVLFDFGTPGGIKHVGMLRKPWSGRGPLYTVEGNTSFSSGGSQDNGGAVAARTRDVSLVYSIVRVKWPA